MSDSNIPLKELRVTEYFNFHHIFQVYDSIRYDPNSADVIESFARSESTLSSFLLVIKIEDEFPLSSCRGRPWELLTKLASKGMDFLWWSKNNSTGS